MKTSLSRIICLLTVLSFAASLSYGQNYKADVSKGDFAIKKGDFEAAAKFYSEAIKSVKNLEKGNLDLLYKLGLSQMQIKNYSKASVSFAQYISIAKNSSSDLSKLKNIMQWKDWCDNEKNDNQQQTASNNSSIYLTNMRVINSSLNDLSITLDNKNEIIFFTSNKLFFGDEKIINIKTNLFSSEFQNDVLKEPIKIGAEINSLGEIISACLTSNNKLLYFTVANEDQSKADIYVCKFNNGKFDKPEKLPKIINSKYFDGYPSISDDGKSLYFVSDRPGGIGGKDIYVSRVLPDGLWSEPYNLGKTINTKYDEITPHIEKSNDVLYFSSKGHPGNGGFDIFYSKITNKNKWGEPINMVEPINSKSDDIAYITTSDPNICYLSSSRKGGSGNFDIYKSGKVNISIPVDEKPLNASNNEGVKDSNLVASDFDEFKKLAEKEKQAPPAIAPKENNIASNQIEKPSNINNETPNISQPQQQNKPIAKPAPITEKPVVKQNVETPKTENIAKKKVTPSVQPQNNNKSGNTDTAILNYSMRGLVFRVQLGAYRNHITVDNAYFERLNKNQMQEEFSEEMLYKYTIGTFENVDKASNAKQVLRDFGYSDAFLACYYNGNRISMEEALKMLDNKVYERIAFYSN